MLHLIYHPMHPKRPARIWSRGGIIYCTTSAYSWALGSTVDLPIAWARKQGMRVEEIPRTRRNPNHPTGDAYRNNRRRLKYLIKVLDAFKTGDTPNE